MSVWGNVFKSYRYFVWSKRPSIFRDESHENDFLCYLDTHRYFVALKYERKHEIIILNLISTHTQSRVGLCFSN